jgi:hypothetical protein
MNTRETLILIVVSTTLGVVLAPLSITLITLLK